MSCISIERLLFRYASSLRRSAIISYSNLVVLKISLSGLKVITVPVFFVLPTTSTSVCVLPLIYSCLCFFPSLCTSADSRSERAFTTEIKKVFTKELKEEGVGGDEWGWVEMGGMGGKPSPVIEFNVHHVNQPEEPTH